MGVKPLTVALVAIGLLVIVIGADASMNRTYALDVQVPSAAGAGTTWRTLATMPPDFDDRSRAEPWFGGAEIEANRSDTMTFRIRAENGYYWGLSETFRVHQNGEELASGTLQAPARGETEAQFTVPAARLLGRAPVDDPRAPYIASTSVVVTVDDVFLDGHVTLREVSSE